MHYRRGIGLVILGFVALVTLIASSITAALTLAHSVQTATFVNNQHKMYPLPGGLKKILTKS